MNWSLSLALLFQPLPAIETPDSDAQEIVVIGEKLKSWRGVVKTRKGQPSCRTTKSTGDKAIDAIGCRAMLACIAPEQAALDALAKSSKSREAFRLSSKPIYDRIGECLVSKRRAGIEALAAQRRAI